MSGTQLVEYDGVEISVEDAIEFLNAVENPVDPVCPICAHPDWGVSLSPGGGQFPSFPTRTVKDASMGGGYYIGMFVVECLKCGFMRQHNLTRLASWKKARNAQLNSGEAE